MIISKAPIRLSYIGGGTDYVEWFKQNGGLVIASAINYYSYISINSIQPFREYNYRLCYSQIEEKKKIDEISHPVIRECLRFCNISDKLEIVHSSDLPGFSGTGSSSTFLVALLNGLYSYKNESYGQHEIARLAYHLEHDVLKENIGIQDQIMASVGGLKIIKMHKGGEVEIEDFDISLDKINELHSYTMLYHTQIYRKSSDIAATYVNKISSVSSNWTMLKLAQDGVKAIRNYDWEKLGNLIDSSYKLKTKLSSSVSTLDIAKYYCVARTCGALGGKIMGSGGGGCMMLIAPPDKQEEINDNMEKLGLKRIPFYFDFCGVKTIFKENYAIKY